MKQPRNSFHTTQPHFYNINLLHRTGTYKGMGRLGQTINIANSPWLGGGTQTPTVSSANPSVAFADIFGNIFNPGQPTADQATAQAYAALVASAQAGGFETPTGSYSINPATGQMQVTPGSGLPGAGPSNLTWILLAAGGVLLLVAMMGGRR
jgi:hypothetical protein